MIWLLLTAAPMMADRVEEMDSLSVMRDSLPKSKELSPLRRTIRGLDQLHNEYIEPQHYEFTVMMQLTRTYESFMLKGKLTYTGKGSFGLAFDYNGQDEKTKIICLNPKEQKLQLTFNEGGTLITETAAALEAGKEYSFTYIQEGSAGIFWLGDEASLTVRLYGVSGKPIRLFTESNTVTWTDLREYTR